MDITTRKATLSDLGILRQFEQGVINAERPFDTTIKADPVRYYDLEYMLSADHVHLIVAEYQNVIIGSGYARIEDAKPFLSHAQHAYLGFMYVVPEHRGKGVNQNIIETLMQWSATKGIKEIQLDVYYDNAAAIHAYEKSGFKKHMIQMRREV